MCVAAVKPELARPITPSASSPTDCRADCAPPRVWMPATWLSGKQGSMFPMFSWTTSGGWAPGEPSGRGGLAEGAEPGPAVGSGLVLRWMTLTAGMVSWTGPAWMGTKVE